MKHLNIKISGKVQRVGYRFSAMQAAYRYGIRGFVQNMPEGWVYIEAEGQDSDLKNFTEWCRKGPFGCRVESAEFTEGDLVNFTSFEIIRSDLRQ
jgi:acylphosphatase